jgi:hypothetical protein
MQQVRCRRKMYVQFKSVRLRLQSCFYHGGNLTEDKAAEKGIEF